MRLFTAILFISICSTSFGQKMKDLKAFKHYSVTTANDTINYHTFSKKPIDSTKTLLLYVQGSSAKSLYQTMEEDGKNYIGTVIPFDFNLLPDDYLFVVA